MNLKNNSMENEADVIAVSFLYKINFSRINYIILEKKIGFHVL